MDKSCCTMHKTHAYVTVLGDWETGRHLEVSTYVTLLQNVSDRARKVNGWRSEREQRSEKQTVGGARSRLLEKRKV